MWESLKKKKIMWEQGCLDTQLRTHAPHGLLDADPNKTMGLLLLRNCYIDPSVDRVIRHH